MYTLLPASPYQILGTCKARHVLSLDHEFCAVDLDGRLHCGWCRGILRRQGITQAEKTYLLDNNEAYTGEAFQPFVKNHPA